MPPRNSRIKPFKKYDIERYEPKDELGRVIENKTCNIIDDVLLDPLRSPDNKYFQDFNRYKKEMAAKGLRADTTVNAITKDESEEDPRYRDKEWYKLRAAGDSRGWDIDGARCDGRNKHCKKF